ncbi:MAG: hypothetical protein ACREBG_13165 [Pyrinomonadaceae bacterium]
MFKTVLSLVLVTLLITCVAAQTAYADSKAEKQIRFTEKVKLGIAKLGTGEQARIELKLRDKTKLKGYVREVGEEDFVVADAKTGANTRVAYAQVQTVKGNNLSTGAKIAIGLGILAAILAIWLILENTG